MLGNVRKTAASMAALAALAAPQLAAAQDCVQEADLADMAIYSVPMFIDSAQSKCGSELSKDGFLATQGAVLRSRYAALQDKAWPGAKRAISVVLNNSPKFAPFGQMSRDLPDERMRTLVDTMGPTVLMPEIRASDCKNIESGLALIAPLDPKSAANLVGTFLGSAARDELKICEGTSA